MSYSAQRINAYRKKVSLCKEHFKIDESLLVNYLDNHPKTFFKENPGINRGFLDKLIKTN